MNRYYYFHGLLRSSLMAVFLLSATLASLGQEAKQQKVYYGDKATVLAPGANYVKVGEATPVPSRVKFDEKHYIPVADFFTWLKGTYNLDPAIQFIPLRVSADENGNMHQRYAVKYKNVEIDQNWIRVHSRDGMVYSFNGNVQALNAVNTEPNLSEEEALQYALKTVGTDAFLWLIPREEELLKERRNDQTATYYPAGELVIVKQDGKDGDEAFGLTWRFDIRTVEPGKDAKVFIDAKTGEKIKSYPLSYQCDAGTVASTWYGTQSISTYQNGGGDYILYDDCGAATIRTTQTDGSDFVASDNNWTSSGETGPGTTHLHGRIAMDYYDAVHSRDSYDDADGDLEIRYIDDANAYWSGGGLMRIGNSNSTVDAEHYNTLDVVAHEFTHGVTDFEANLTYAGESGALNESFSDIFGETCEIWYEGLPANQWDWLHREDYYNGNNRSFINPNDKGDPDTYNGTNWANTCGGCADNGGVHTNSGVQNFWFYLLTVGGSGTNDNGDDYTVSGLGLVTARTISYDNLTDQLGTSSNYSDARDGAIAAAEDRYGVCSNQVRQVMNAWYAVGVGNPAVDVEIAISTDISCFGADDGSITISVVGTSPYTYAWSDGPTSKNRTGLSPGVYTVTVTDATGCTSSVGTLISEPNQLTATITNESDHNGYNISCKGGNDGWATVTAGGGTPPYKYSWSNGQTTATATNLSAGFYTVTITDNNVCTASTSITITEPPLLTISISDVSDYNGYNISCNGGSDGWATASASGGAGTYSYLWSDNQGTATASNLMAGTYYVTVTDDNGCTASTSVTMTEPDPLTIDAGENQTVYYGYPPAECATIAWSGEGGGVPPYTIEWSDGGAQSHEVCPGLYTTDYIVTITDDNDCVTMDTVTICVIDVRCGKNLDKVELCHVPPDDPLNVQTLCVGLAAVATHLTEHGDMLAACGTDHSCPPAMAKTDLAGYRDNQGTYLNAFPNPFNQSTTVAFSLEYTGDMTLQLFDNVGRLVEVLYEGKAQQGLEYQFTVDATTLSSGVHICVLHQSDGTQVIKKLIVER